MSIDEHIKALNAINRALDEEHLEHCRKQVEYYERIGQTRGAKMYRESVLELEASLGHGDGSQAA